MKFINLIVIFLCLSRLIPPKNNPSPTGKMEEARPNQPEAKPREQQLFHETGGMQDLFNKRISATCSGSQ